MSFTVSSRSVVFLVFFHLFCRFADSVTPQKNSPTSDPSHVTDTALERSTRGGFARNEKSTEVTAEDLRAGIAAGYRILRRESTKSTKSRESRESRESTKSTKSTKTRHGGKDFESEIFFEKRNFGGKEAIEEKEALRDSRKTAKFPQRSILQVQPRKSRYKQPVDYRLYQEEVALATKKLWPTEWIPEDDRFLLAYCQTGRLSNRVLCILNALNFAAALNRTLLITMDRNEILYHYDRRLIFDLDYFRSCYGTKTLMTIEEYRDLYKKDVVVDQVICLCGKPCRQDFSVPNSTYMNQGHVTFLKSAFSFKRPREYVRLITVDELKMEVGDAPGQILFMGEFFYNSLKTENYLILPVKRSDQCTSNVAVLPHRSILIFGKRFVKDVFQGQKYMAVHLRREDFSIYCDRGLGCFLPIELVVECLKEKIKLHDIKMVYLATNTNAKEIGYIMRNLTDKNNERVQIVRLKTELLKENNWVLPIPEGDEDIQSLWEAQLDKVICLHAPVFVGSARSTYSVDIQRMRYAFGYATPNDTYLCESSPIAH